MLYNELVFSDNIYLERKLDSILVRLRKALAAKFGCLPIEDKRKLTATIRERFRLEPARLFFDDKELKIGTGAALRIAKLLVQNLGDLVAFKKLDERSSTNEASSEIRTSICRIKKRSASCQYRFRLKIANGKDM